MIPDMSKIAGGCVATGTFPNLTRNRDFLFGEEITEGIKYQSRLLSAESCQALRTYYESQGEFAPVSVQGMAPEGSGAQVGSCRITCWDPAFGYYLWEMLRYTAPFRHMYDTSSTDWHQDNPDKRRDWHPVGVSPMARYMRYDQGGQHFAHYDAGYIYPDGPGLRRTLMSGVLYLTTNKTGDTRFIKDGQESLPVWERNHADWDREVKPEEVLRQFSPEEGSVLLFDHRLTHDVSRYDGAEGPRIIIRFDVIFQAFD